MEEETKHRYINKSLGFYLNNNLKECSIKEIEYGVAYMLQMVDIGIIDIHSYANPNVKVVGFIQYMKPNDDSYILRILRLFQYIPMLSFLDEKKSYCRSWTLEEMALLFFESEYCKLDLNSQKLILNFIKELKELGYKAGDWEENYFPRIDNNEKAIHSLKISKLDYNLTQVNYLEDAMEFIMKSPKGDDNYIKILKKIY